MGEVRPRFSDLRSVTPASTLCARSAAHGAFLDRIHVRCPAPCPSEASWVSQSAPLEWFQLRATKAAAQPRQENDGHEPRCHGVNTTLMLLKLDASAGVTVAPVGPLVKAAE